MKQRQWNHGPSRDIHRFMRSSLRRSMMLIAMLAAFAAAISAAQAAEQPEHSDHQHHHMEATPESSERHDPHAEPARQPTEGEQGHIPPDPPQLVMGDMSEREMAEMMDMDDTAGFGMVMFDQLEWQDTDDGDALAWNGRGWYGNDYDKALLKTEGERTDGEYSGRVDGLWDHVVSRWWSLQAGVAHGFGDGPSRTWATFGVQGLAPYLFEVEAHLYVGVEGRTAARASAEYEMFLTQRWVLQPKIELNIYGKDDPANDLGSGLSDAELGLRLRYEIRREVAPYAGVVWSRLFGETADLAGDEGGIVWVAGLRAWF